MKLVLTKHAKQRMIERSITLNEIEEAIEMPNYTLSKSNKIEAYKKFPNKSLKIVYAKEGNFIKVITVVDKWK